MCDKNMIEEINVNRCKYFNNGWCLLSESCDAIRYKLCGDMTLFDCYYKQLQREKQECRDLKDKNEYLINTYCHFKNEIKKYKKAVHKYKVDLQDKIKRLHLSRREFLKEINSIPVRIACKGEEFKNALDKFNNAIQVINNEDRYKQAVDKIEKIANKREMFCEYCSNYAYDFICEDCGYCKILNILKKVKDSE